MANDKTDILVDISIVPNDNNATDVIKTIEKDTKQDVNNFSVGISLKTGTANILQGSSTEINNLKNTFNSLQLPDSVFQLTNSIANEQTNMLLSTLLQEGDSFNAGAVLEIYFSIILFLILQDIPVTDLEFDRIRKQIPVTKASKTTHTITSTNRKLKYTMHLQLTSRGTAGVSQKKKGDVTEFVGLNAVDINNMPPNVLRPLRTMMSVTPNLPLVKTIQTHLNQIKQDETDPSFDIMVSAIGSTVDKDDVESSNISLDAYEINNLLNNIYEYLSSTNDHKPIWNFLGDMMLGSTKSKWLHFDSDFAYFDIDILQTARDSDLKFIIRKYNRASRSGYYDLGLAFDIAVIQNNEETIFPVFRLWPQRHSGYSTSFRVECSNKQFTKILNQLLISTDVKIVNGAVVTSLNFKSPREKDIYQDEPSAFSKPANVKKLISLYYQLTNQLNNPSLSADDKTKIKLKRKKIKNTLGKLYKK